MLEATWDWLVSDKNHHMYVDIFVADQKLCVEYQGQQHYFYPNRFHKSYEDFQDQRRRDVLKKELLVNHGFRYIAWRFNEPILITHVIDRLEAIGIKIDPKIKEEALEMPAPKPRRRRIKKTNRSKKTPRKGGNR